jgi:hypothetical protein
MNFVDLRGFIDWSSRTLTQKIDSAGCHESGRLAYTQDGGMKACHDSTHNPLFCAGLHPVLRRMRIFGLHGPWVCGDQSGSHSSET